MNYILFDTFDRTDLLPLNFLRPNADIRFGILTIREKWEKYLNSPISSLTETYLSKKYPMVQTESNLLIDGTVCPSKDLLHHLSALNMNEALVCKNQILAIKLESFDPQDIFDKKFEGHTLIEYSGSFLKINNTWDIFSNNARALQEDFDLLTKDKTSNSLNSSNYINAEQNIFIAANTKINNASLNASEGPIYIDEGAEIMEGALIRGPFYLGKNSVVKMGAKIYGATTIGPQCKVGGEVNNVVMFANSNKGHEGFIGNAVIAEWCNIGAGTNNSNLKNTYDIVKLWNYSQKSFVNTDLQFCGLIMGDHSKCGINTMFNTGTVIGISANIFGTGFQRNFIQSFAWGGTRKMIKYDFQRAINTAKQTLKRRDCEFDKLDEELFTHIYDLSLKDPQL